MRIRTFEGDLPYYKQLDAAQSERALGLLTLEKPEGAPLLVPDFTLHTSAMTADEKEPGIVRMVGSSTERDMQGDTMSLTALSDMAQAPIGLTIWLNHVYELPGSIFGSLVEQPKMVQQGQIADLHIASDVERDNPAAAQTYKYIQNGRRLGCSVGCMVLEYEIDEANDDGGWFPPIIIHHVLPLEWSVCAIPANQRCWAEQATKGLFARTFDRRLAPAVKGMYPRQYGDLIAACPDAALRRDLERVAARPTDPRRVEWVPLSKTFVLNTRGKVAELPAGLVEEVIKSAQAAPRGTAPESDDEQVAFRPEYPAAGLVERKSFFDEIEEQLGFARREDAEPDLVRGACGKTSWPLADIGTEWTGSKAEGQIFEWARDDDGEIVPSKAKQCFLYFNPDDTDKQSGYKMPFCYVSSGSPKIVPLGVRACANVLNGGMSGVSASDADKASMKAKCETMYGRINSEFKPDPEWVVPWKKEDAAMPDLQKTGTEPPGEPTPAERGSAGVLSAAQQALLEQYNLVGLALGLPPVARTEAGAFVYASSAPERPGEAFEQVLVRVLELQKAGAEFSKENMAHLTALHRTLRAMTGDKICGMDPAPTMDGDDDADDNGDENNTVGGHGGPPPEEEKAGRPGRRSARRAWSYEELAAVVHDAVRGAVFAQLGDISKALAGLNVRALEQSVAVAQNSLLDLKKQIADVQGETREAAGAAAQLIDLPLGRPTNLRRQVAPGEASYSDFLALSGVGGAAPREKWQGTLEQALARCSYEDVANEGYSIKYRVWPAGVGGSVREGVRPALSGQQKSLMAPGWIVAYNEGGEARVPLVDFAELSEANRPAEQPAEA